MKVNIIITHSFKIKANKTEKRKILGNNSSMSSIDILSDINLK